MVFLDCRLLERKGGTTSLVKLLVKEEDLLIVTVNKAISKFIKSTNVKHVNETFKRIKNVTCNRCSLVDFIIDDNDFNLHALNSHSTPIFDKGIDILLSPIEHSSANAKKAKTICAQAMLMNQVQLELTCCKRIMKDANKEPQIDEKILDRVHEVFEEIELGCWSNDQKEQLIKNAGHLMKSLCFIRKHWRVLLRADYPQIPEGEEDFTSSKLLNAITGLTRMKKNERA